MDIIKERVYHGTTESSVDGIRENGFLFSQKDNEWLGKGIYFFKYKADADWWVERPRNKKNGSEDKPVILGVDLLYKLEQLLDLDDREQLEKVSTFFLDAISRTNKVANLQGRLNNKDPKVWCAACNLYREAYQNIAVTKYTFRWEEKTLVYAPNQLQICVTDANIIQELEVLQ